MPRVLEPAQLAALAEPVVRWLILVRYEFDSGAIAFCNLLDDYEFQGVTYTGMGDLGNISEAVENTALDPSYFDVTLSGVKTELLSAALNEDYVNRECFVYLCVMDESYKSIGTPWQFFYGKITDMQCTYGTDSQIVVTAADEAYEWDRPKLERYTDQEQRQKYPGDTGFRFVAQLSGKTLIWPSRQWFVDRA